MACAHAFNDQLTRCLRGLAEEEDPLGVLSSLISLGEREMEWRWHQAAPHHASPGAERRILWTRCAGKVKVVMKSLIPARRVSPRWG